MCVIRIVDAFAICLCVETEETEFMVADTACMIFTSSAISTLIETFGAAATIGYLEFCTVRVSSELKTNASFIITVATQTSILDSIAHSFIVPVFIAEETKITRTLFTFLVWVHCFVDSESTALTNLTVNMLHQRLQFLQ
jgi:hypothetical protein